MQEFFLKRKEKIEIKQNMNKQNNQILCMIDAKSQVISDE